MRGERRRRRGGPGAKPQKGDFGKNIDKPHFVQIKIIMSML